MVQVLKEKSSKVSLKITELKSHKMSSSQQSLPKQTTLDLDHCR